VRSNNSESNRQILVANLSGLIGYTITLIMSVIAYKRQDKLLGFVLLIASLPFFSSHLILRSKRLTSPYKLSANLLTTSLMLLMFYLVFAGGIKGAGPL
jgi:predicted neutral ceramidase superfamily lipid hydrolase